MTRTRIYQLLDNVLNIYDLFGLPLRWFPWNKYFTWFTMIPWIIISPTDGGGMPWHTFRWLLCFLWSSLMCEMILVSAGSPWSEPPRQFPTLGPSLYIPDSVCAERSHVSSGSVCECRHTVNQLLTVNCSSRSLITFPGSLPYNTSIL